MSDDKDDLGKYNPLGLSLLQLMGLFAIIGIVASVILHMYF